MNVAYYNHTLLVVVPAGEDQRTRARARALQLAAVCVHISMDLSYQAIRTANQAREAVSADIKLLL